MQDRDLYTPLHAAVAAGRVDCVRMLIEAGADIEAKNVYGNTPLHIACLNGHVEAVAELIRHSANIGKFALPKNIFISFFGKIISKIDTKKYKKYDNTEVDLVIHCSFYRLFYY